MRWWKTVLAIMLIIASLYAMYQWNMQGKAKLASVQAELAAVKEAAMADAERDPDEDVYKSGRTFFVIPRNWVYSCSVKVKAGSRIGIYSMRLRDKLGSFAVSYADPERIEIACSLDDYYRIHDLIYCTGEKEDAEQNAEQKTEASKGKETSKSKDTVKSEDPGMQVYEYDLLITTEAAE